MPTNEARRGRPEGVRLDGRVLKDRRSTLGLSQSAAADLARIGARTVRTAESGSPVSPETARLLSHALGLAYLEVVRPPADLVRERLATSGLGPLPFQGDWMPIGEPEQALTQAIEVLARDSGVVVVEGPDGIGKSSLVRRVLEQPESANNPWDMAFPDGVAWLAADRSEDPEVDVAMRLELAGALGFSDRLPNRRVVAALAWDDAFRGHLWRGRRLLVLDDVPDLAVVQRFTASQGAARVACVVTTGRQWVAEALADEGAARVRLVAWPEERILSLLQSTLSADRLQADPSGTRALLELVGGLPLYARLAATGLQRARHRTFRDWVEGVRGAIRSVQSGAAGTMRGPAARDPMVRGLLDGVGSTLSPAAVQAVRDLSVNGSHHFGLQFALGTVDGEPSRARAVLDELADAYLLRVVSDSGLDEPRFQLPEWAIGVWGGPSDAAFSRLMHVGPELIGHLVDIADDPRRLDGLSAAQHGVMTVLDRILARLGAGPAARSPDQVPALSSPLLSGAEHLPTAFARLEPMLRYTPPDDAGRWLTCGLSVLQHPDIADDAPSQRLVPVLAWWLGWWWWNVLEDADAALGWVGEAVHHADVLEPDTAASLAVHALVLEWSIGTSDRRASAVERALSLAAHAAASPGVKVSASLHAAAHCLLDVGDRSSARTHCEQAVSTSGEDVRLPILHAAARLARTVVDAGVVDPVAGQEDLLASDAAKVLAQLTQEPLVRAAVAHHVRALGGGVLFDVPDPHAAWLAVDTPEVPSVLKQLEDVLGAIGAMPGAEQAVFDTQSPLGPVAATVVSGSPFGTRSGASFILFLPLDPVREILTGSAREAAMRFVAAVRSEEHPVWRALSGLV